MTDRDYPGPAEPADGPAHPVDDGDHAAVSARAREGNTATSDDAEMSDCGSADQSADQSAETLRSRRRRFLGGLHPPDIWQDRPGLGRLAAYAYHGAGAPETGPLRTIQIWWFRLICLPIAAWSYWKAWLLERPLRGAPVLTVQIAWWLLNIATLIRYL